MDKEVVCSAGWSYLILTQIDGGRGRSKLIRDQKVILFAQNDSDDIAILAKSGPFLKVAKQQPYQFVSIQNEAVIVQRIDNVNEKLEWNQKLAIILQSCESARIRHIAFLRPSVSVEKLFLEHGVQVLVELLAAKQCCLHVTLLAREESYFRNAWRTVSNLGICQPETSTKVRVNEQTLLTSFMSSFRCPICKRFAESPCLLSDNYTCSRCLPSTSQPKPISDFDSLLHKATVRIPVTCRCGVKTTEEALDDHMIDCEKKEWYCGEHQIGGSQEVFFEHLMDKHFELVMKNLGKIVA